MSGRETGKSLAKRARIRSLTAMSKLRLIQWAGLVVATTFLAGCANLPPVGSGTGSTSRGGGSPSRFYDPPAYRPKNPANVRVKISTGAQRLYVVEGDRVLLATPCSVGTASAPTPAGNFTIYSKQAKRRSYSYGNYPMPWWMEFKPAYGIHWGFVKPVPCTHGCVRLPRLAAAKVFAMVPTGARLNVAHSQPEDATIGKTLPRLDDGPLPNPPQSYLMSDQVFHDAQYAGKLYVD